MSLCGARIHARLQSVYWKKPKHRYREEREPLYKSLRKMLSRLHALPNTASNRFENLPNELNELCNAYETIDKHYNEAESLLESLKEVVRMSYDFSTKNGTCSLEGTISSYGLDPSEMCQNGNIRQIQKIGRYWGVCVEMPEVARKYRSLFQHAELRSLPPYTAISSNIFFKATEKPTVKCNVHAEIRLLLYYDLHPKPDSTPPRVLGVSKAACYLCNLFILEHGRFYHTKTHGYLHDQWTVPDLAAYSEEQRNKYRHVLAAIDSEIERAMSTEGSSKRQHPAQSWLSLRTPPLCSPASSDAGTILSGASQTRSMESYTPLAHTNLVTSQVPDPPTSLDPHQVLHDTSSQITLRAVSKSSTPSDSSSSPQPLSSESPEPQPRLSSPSPAAHPSSPPLQPVDPIPPPAPSPPPPRSLASTPPAADHSSSAPIPMSHPTPRSISPLIPTPTASRAPSPATPVSPALLLPPSRSPPHYSSLISDDLPATQSISPTRPLYVSSGWLSTTVKIEPPSSGYVKISGSSRELLRESYSVNIDALLPNEERSFLREVGASSLLLHLHRQHRQGIQLELAWA